MITNPANVAFHGDYEITLDCPFDWQGLTVKRWNGTHQDGIDCAFVRKNGILVRVRGEEPARDDAIRFGKHKGAPWSEIPEKYLRWVAENVKGSSKRAKQELKQRKGTSD